MVARLRPASEVAAELLARLADEPRVVSCDLTGMTPHDLGDGQEFAPVADYLAHWPGTVVMIHAPDPAVRAVLSAADFAHRMLVHSTCDGDDIEAQRLLPRLQRRSLTLTPQPTAPGTARDFVTRTLQDWRLATVLTPASQLVSEFVTHAVIHAGSDLDLAVSRVDTRVRLAISYPTPDTSTTTSGDLLTCPLSDRGRQLVDTLAEAWGVIPGHPTGGTVWAILEGAGVASAAADEADQRREPAGPRHRGPADADVLAELHSGARAGRHRQDDGRS